ncbi:hypothetical protein CDG77_21760 [Nostoc sp. 'Peltigera membranacea cyanobiont' 213]|uniref:DUF4291 domain-containing protein n=1 Tax=Nostoc sp. 'Peltigera membranacea cyanobiont' 213 TaxID=2014530 RepID=UPI000B950DA1|nr:DUF4291 domain-containing protein [Nostoc sp. 'Peltigera membranacea cyanobiont' 213]OYD88803.1 hypothetical protein CDG77_21760 [Nostoc sp. 'Peltigera membranacea cyanobiont' 213]
MRLITEPYLTQVSNWPKNGRHILAQYDDHSIVVYQAYRPAIGHFAAIYGYFGGEFSFDRMSWIKPNFLWMMYRSGWGTENGQEVVLAISMKRSAFDEILAAAIHSSYVPELYPDKSVWQKALKRSQVRLQWDPDHHPTGTKLERRAIQLGLRGQVLATYAKDWIVNIEDISDFVQKQRQNIKSDCAELITPQEKVYSVFDTETQAKLGLSAWTE